MTVGVASGYHGNAGSHFAMSVGVRAKAPFQSPSGTGPHISLPRSALASFVVSSERLLFDPLDLNTEKTIMPHYLALVRQ
jgi:hypothetical protein